MNKHFWLLSLLLISLHAGLEAQIFEAEEGVLVQTTIGQARSGFSGKGYVTQFHTEGASVTIRLEAPATGLYFLSICHANEGSDKNNFVIVNGENEGDKFFKYEAGFQETNMGRVWLKAGPNTVQILKSWGYFDVDYLKIQPAAPAPPPQISAKLITPNPLPAAQALMNRLVQNYGKKMISGQQGLHDVAWIEQISQQRPAMLGLDLLNYSLAWNQPDSTIEKAIDWSQNQHGIVTLCWHWFSPKGAKAEIWRSFYTNMTTFDVEQALIPGTEEHTLLIRDLDAIALQLKRLQDAQVPVLWRPLHEAEGRWFWWGAKGPAACKKLYYLMFDRLVHLHQLNNLIWVWTSADFPHSLEWYPGAAYVDVVGADIYLPAGHYSASFNTFDNLAQMYPDKILALTEIGTLPQPDQCIQKQARWSWFTTWSGLIADTKQNSPAFLNLVFQHPYVITLAEIKELDAGTPNIKK